ncbi:MAG: hypothetical protein ACLP70_20700 [Streptosporangiaceae bacterium]
MRENAEQDGESDHGDGGPGDPLAHVIGAVTSKRSSRADSIPQPNTSAATIARSEALIRSPAGGSAQPASLARLAG